MQRDPSQYADAARLLWDLPPDRLEAMASGRLQTSQSVRDAVQMALGVKRDYLNPEDFGSQQAAIDRLAGSLAMLPDFSLQEIAIATGHSPTRRTGPAAVVAAPTRSRHRVFRVVLIVLLLLVALEALARAGVEVPSPIGTIIDQLGGDPGSDATSGEPRSLVDPEVAAFRSDFGALSLPVARRSTRAVGGADPKNERSARGRELHQAQGREQHHAQGREQHQAQGRALHKAVRPAPPRPSTWRAERIARRTAGKARATIPSRANGGRGYRGRGRRFK